MSHLLHVLHKYSAPITLAQFFAGIIATFLLIVFVNPVAGLLALLANVLLSATLYAGINIAYHNQYSSEKWADTFIELGKDVVNDILARIIHPYVIVAAAFAVLGVGIAKGGMYAVIVAGISFGLIGVAFVLKKVIERVSEQRKIEEKKAKDKAKTSSQSKEKTEEASQRDAPKKTVVEQFADRLNRAPMPGSQHLLSVRDLCKVKECAKEVVKYLDETDGARDKFHDLLKEHLLETGVDVEKQAQVNTAKLKDNCGFCAAILRLMYATKENDPMLRTWGAQVSDSLAKVINKEPSFSTDQSRKELTAALGEWKAVTQLDNTASQPHVDQSEKKTL